MDEDPFFKIFGFKSKYNEKSKDEEEEKENKGMYLCIEYWLYCFL